MTHLTSNQSSHSHTSVLFAVGLFYWLKKAYLEACVALFTLPQFSVVFSPCGLSDGVTCWQNWRGRQTMSVSTGCLMSALSCYGLCHPWLHGKPACSTAGAACPVTQGWGFGLDFISFSSFRRALESSKSEWKLVGGCMVQVWPPACFWATPLPGPL